MIVLLETCKQSLMCKTVFSRWSEAHAYGWAWEQFLSLYWICGRETLEQEVLMWFFLFVPVKVLALVLWIANRDIVCRLNKNICNNCALNYCHMMPYAPFTVKHKNAAVFPPPWSFHCRMQPQGKGSGDERPSCMTHLFIKRWRLSATDLSGPMIKEEAGWCWGRRTFHRLAQPSAAKLLFIPAEHMMTRLWQKASLRMTK